jgi:hypothetical protein
MDGVGEQKKQFLRFASTPRHYLDTMKKTPFRRRWARKPRHLAQGSKIRYIFQSHMSSQVYSEWRAIRHSSRSYFSATTLQTDLQPQAGALGAHMSRGQRVTRLHDCGPLRGGV